jgi:DNA-binding MarR family transcriptional regulator
MRTSTFKLRRGRASAASPTRPERPLGSVLEFMRSLWGVNHGLESTSRRMKARLGVTGPERMVVRLVGRYPGISAGELAWILRVHPSTLTGLLKRLVRRGLLAREVSSRDARRAVLTLTPRGAAVDRIRRGTVEASVRAALSELPERDVETAVAVLEALIRRFEG